MKLRELISKTTISMVVLSLLIFSTSNCKAAETMNYYSMVKNNILQSKTYDEFYDVNDDGVVNVFDAIRINQNECHEDLKKELSDLKKEFTDLKSDLSQSNSTLKAFGFYDIENLYNKYASGIEVGGYYGGNDGKWVSWNNYAETDYYRISKNDKFYLSRNNNGTIEHPASISTCFYDSNKNFICGIGDSANGIYTVPNRDNIYYARTAYATDKTEFMIVKGDKIPSKYRYVPFIPETSEIVNVPEKILDFNKTLIDAGFVSRISPNLFDKDAKGIEVGGYYGGNDGKWVEWAGFAETDYYRINPSDKFYLSRKNGDAVENPAALSTCFYDINKNFICGIGESKNGIYTVPRNANIYYARTAYSTTKPEFMIIKGSEIPSSYTYYPYSDETKNENINAVFAKLQDNQWYGKKWYAYGTSLTNTANEGKYAKYVEQFSGMIRVNKGNSGGGIVTNTINKQAIMNITDGKLEADLITFEVGANDTSAVIGDIYDTSDNTFCGALNQCIRYLQANTNAQIVVISSPNSRYQYPNPDDKLPPETKFGTDNHTKYDQWKAIREVCAINSCYYIPMGEGANMSYARMNASDLYNVDQIHHTELGGYNLGKFVWHQLKNIPNWYASMPT